MVIKIKVRMQLEIILSRKVMVVDSSKIYDSTHPRKLAQILISVMDFLLLNGL